MRGGAIDSASLEAALGYPAVLTTDAIRRQFERGGIAYRIVTEHPSATWGVESIWVAESDNLQISTPFEAEFAAFAARLGLWRTCWRADILARLEPYSVIVFGLPGDDVSTPLDAGGKRHLDEIQYLSVYPQTRARIVELETNKGSAAYGQPRTYELSPTAIDGVAGGQIGGVRVHASRIVHVVSDPVLDDWQSTPVLARVWNYLLDLTKLVGGGSESAFARGRPGLHAKLPSDVNLTADEEAAIDKEIQAYQDRVSATIRTQGIDIEQLSGGKGPNFGPDANFLLQLIAGTVGMPVRMLIGSERGELASTQDDDNWRATISRRRSVFADHLILEIVNRLVSAGFITAPKAARIVWPSRDGLSLQDRAGIAVSLANANAASLASTGELLVTSAEIREHALGFDPLSTEIESPREEAAPKSASSDLQRSGATSGPALRLVEAAFRYSAVMREAVEQSVDELRTDLASRGLDVLAGVSADTLLSSCRDAISRTADVRGATIRNAVVDVFQYFGSMAGTFTQVRKRREPRGARAVRTRSAANAGIELSFDALLPGVVEWVSVRSAHLVTEIDRSILEALQVLIAEGFENNIAPAKLGRAIESYVGLRTDQIRAVSRFEDRLLGAEPGSIVYAGAREVTIPRGGATAAFVDKQTQRYAADLLKQRGELIARTETLRAANAALRESWHQSQAAGLISNIKREWIATDDERTRDEHADLDGQETGIDDPFDPPIEPGEEPNCRCSQGLVVG